MSWQVNGRVYHSHAEYESARAADSQTRLAQTVADFRAPAVDTSSTTQRLAHAQAQRAMLERARASVTTSSAALERDIAGASQSVRDVFVAAERARAELSAGLEQSVREADASIERLAEERQQHTAAANADIDAVLRADRESDERADRAAAELVARAEHTMRAVDAAEARRAGLDTELVRTLIDRAVAAPSGERGLLARHAAAEASALARNVEWQQSLIAAHRQMHHSQIAALQRAIDFPDETRRELVGAGERALDVPMRRELARLAASLDRVEIGDSATDRFAEIGAAIDRVAEAVGDLTTKVSNYEVLEGVRFDLVRNRLTSHLETVLGESLTPQAEHIPTVRLQPVEVAFRTANGERVDCSVGIDGSLRIHHHGHANQRTCAAAAERLANGIPELMSMHERPRMDIASASVRREEDESLVERSEDA